MAVTHTIDPAALISVATYSGAEDPQDWLDHVRAMADLYQWNEATCCKVATIRLKGAAQRWAQQRTFTSWPDFCQQMEQRFGEIPEVASAHLEQCFQKPLESPHAFADRFLQTAAKAGRSEDPALLYSFTQRLLPELTAGVLRQRLHSIADVARFCEFWLNTLEPGRESHQHDSSPTDLEVWEECDESSKSCESDFEDQEHELSMLLSDIDADWQEHLALGVFDLLVEEEHQLLELQQFMAAQDREILSLRAALRERALQQAQQQHKQQLQLLQAPSGDNVITDRCLNDIPSNLLVCTPHESTAGIGSPLPTLPMHTRTQPCASTPVLLMHTCVDSPSDGLEQQVSAETPHHLSSSKGGAASDNGLTTTPRPCLLPSQSSLPNLHHHAAEHSGDVVTPTDTTPPCPPADDQLPWHHWSPTHVDYPTVYTLRDLGMLNIYDLGLPDWLNATTPLLEQHNSWSQSIPAVPSQHHTSMLAWVAVPKDPGKH